VSRVDKRGLAAAAVLGILGLLVFYRGFFFSGFTAVQGDEADGRLTSFIATHWLDPSRWGSWLDLGMFYPLTDTLGFSDWLLANGVLAAPFAFLGVPAYAAFQWSLIVISATGYASMVTFLKIGPRVSWTVSIVASLAFTFGNAMYVASEHPQLATVSWLPLAPLLTLFATRSRRWWMWALTLGVLLGFILMTGFYVFWFIWLAALVITIVAFTIRVIRDWMVIHRQRLVKIAAVSLAGMAPFVAIAAPIYLRALDIGRGQRGDADILYWSLSPRDYVNVSTSNAVWGDVIDALYPADLWWRSSPSEWSYAPTPLLWLLAGLALLLAIRRWRSATVWESAAVGSLISGLILEFLLIRIGPIFPWSLIIHIPGATAVRALGRLQLVAAFLLLVGVAVIVDRWWRTRPRSRLLSAAAVLVCLLIVMEQVNLEPRQENGPDRRNALASLPLPPAECETFVVLRPLIPDDLSPPTQIDAMLVSRSTGVKSMHGYTGIEPPGWNLTNSWEPDYRARVEDRISQFEAEAITCGLDLGDRTWLSPTELQAELSGVT
jgi:hypothetical protein